ncbi:polysaccharide biosynthesis tyrosine autokinase [uncultured Microbacterium sp.]|uniref:polysaccharide biosynthesis tyrosine autokinase n=1 Tax=uncultured Microbacterium sp. TaxID=191216 RepID=UPI0028D1750C|nr:polysaccharide biosynthesis tyrosine autokinase [uncultured Microbacterium sp.]
MELRDYIRGLRRHWIAVVLMTIVGVAVSYGWYAVQTPAYEATAVGLVKTREAAIADEVNQSLMESANDSVARGKVPTYLDMATWKPVADRVIEDLGLTTTPDRVVTRVAFENPENTNIIRVTASGGSPEDAAALAQSWLESLAVQIDEVEGDGAAGSAPVSIFVTGSAILPQTPVYPDLQTALIVGGVLGLGVGIAFALMRTASDRRIRGADDVEARTGLPVVGIIPLTDLPSDSRLLDAGSLRDSKARFAVAEALRTLRTNLQFMDVDHPPRIIVVTSPVPSDGKSTIACNLAITLAANGKAVVLVDGDLRRSTVATTMGLPGSVGLSDVLAGRAEIADVLQSTPRAESLFVLAAGSTPPNPSEVLGSERMRTLIHDLAKHATVIIDAPPLLPVTDGAVLTHQADGALLVVSMGKTTYDLLEKALDTIGKAGGRALGVVLNKAPMKGIDSSAYSYEYRREYTKPTKKGGARRKPAETDRVSDILQTGQAVSAPDTVVDTRVKRG